MEKETVGSKNRRTERRQGSHRSYLRAHSEYYNTHKYSQVTLVQTFRRPCHGFPVLSESWTTTDGSNKTATPPPSTEETRSVRQVPARPQTGGSSRRRSYFFTPRNTLGKSVTSKVSRGRDGTVARGGGREGSCPELARVPSVVRGGEDRPWSNSLSTPG